MLTVSGAAPQLQSSSDILLSSHRMICHFCINIHFGCSAPQTVRTVVIHSPFDPKIDLGWQETGHQENVIQQTESAAITTPSKPKSPLATSNQRVHKNNQASSWCQLAHHEYTSIHFSIPIAETQLKAMVQISSTDRYVFSSITQKVRLCFCFLVGLFLTTPQCLC